MNANDGIRQRKAMASGGDLASGTFGVGNVQNPGPQMAPESEMTKGHTPDGDRRGATPPVKHTKGKFPSQANADHGSHGPMGSK